MQPVVVEKFKSGLLGIVSLAVMRKAVVVGWEGRLGSVRLSCQWLPLAFGGDAPGVGAAGDQRGTAYDSSCTRSLANRKRTLHKITKETPTNKEIVVVVTSLEGHEVGCRIQN